MLHFRSSMEPPTHLLQIQHLIAEHEEELAKLDLTRLIPGSLGEVGWDVNEGGVGWDVSEGGAGWDVSEGEVGWDERDAVTNDTKKRFNAFIFYARTSSFISLPHFPTAACCVPHDILHLRVPGASQQTPPYELTCHIAA